MACLDLCCLEITLLDWSTSSFTSKQYIDCEQSLNTYLRGHPYYFNDVKKLSDPVSQVQAGDVWRVGSVQKKASSDHSLSCPDNNNGLSVRYTLLPVLEITCPSGWQLKFINDNDSSVLYVRSSEFGNTVYTVTGNAVVYDNSSNGEPLDVITPSKDDLLNYFVGVASALHPGYTFDRVYSGFNNYECYSVCKVVDISSGEEPTDCLDLRSSGSTELCHLIFTTDDPDNANALTQRDYDLLFQPDSVHTSGSISLSNMGASGYVGFSALKSVGARFDNSISTVRGNGIITVYGRAHIMLYGAALGLYPPLEPSAFVNSFDSEEYIIARFVFDDPCCATPTGYSDERDTLINAIDTWIQSEVGNAAHINNGYIELTRIAWSGFERLTDYCCDESECSESESFENNINLRFPCGSSGDGGGGCVVDLTCVCDNLALMNRKFDSIIEQLSGLNNKLLQLNGIIEDKDFSVTVEPCSPEINIEPCEPQITVSPSPVPVTVQSATPTINVSPSPVPVTVQSATPTINVSPSPVPVTVQSATPTINVEPCQPQITVTSSCPDVYVNNSDLISCLNGLFKVDSDSLAKIMNDSLKVTYQDSISGEVVTDGLAKVIKDKEFESDVICEVSKVDWAYEGYGNIRIPNDN